MKEIKGFSVIEIEKERVSIVGINEQNYLCISNSNIGSLLIDNKYYKYWVTKTGSVSL